MVTKAVEESEGSDETEWRPKDVITKGGDREKMRGVPVFPHHGGIRGAQSGSVPHVDGQRNAERDAGIE